MDSKEFFEVIPHQNWPDDDELTNKNLDPAFPSNIMVKNELIECIDDNIENMPESDEQKYNNLKILLASWNYERLTDHLYRQGITMNTLKCIKAHHIEKILKDYPNGTQIEFEHHLEKWRNEIGIPLSYQAYWTTSTAVPVQSEASSSKGGTTSYFKSYRSCSSPYSICNSSSRGSSSELSDTPSLSNILNNSNKGIMLMELYKKTQRFQEDQRHMLINIIAHYFDENNFKMTLQTSYKLENEIVNTFPNEKLEFYRVGKRGKIYNKCSNLKANVKPISKFLRAEKNKETTTNAVKNFEPEVDAEQCIQSLKYDNLSTNDFDSYWKACTQHRLNMIKNSTFQEIILNWPFYKHSRGYLLIEMDFCVMFENTGSILDDWSHNYESILNFLAAESHIKDKTIKSVVENLKSVTNDKADKDGSAALLWALHGFLVPTQKLVRKDGTGKKSIIKFTIKDSQDSFLYIGETMQQLDNHIDFIKKRSEHIEPFILAIGDDIFNLSEIFVYLDGVKFKFTNILRAVDICFKSFYLFKIEYPKASTHFWNFIQIYFYKLNPEKSTTKIAVLMRDISK